MYISKTPINTPVNFSGSPKKTESKPAQNTSNRLIIGALMALASLNPVNAATNENDSTQVVVEYADDYNDGEEYTSVAETVRFNDENGILEESDFEYSSPEAKKNAQYYLKGLQPFIGKKNTQATDDMAKHLVHLFNRCSNYSYDLKSDENVKDAEAFIKYDKTGRIISTKLKSSFGYEQVVNFKYYKNGNIDRATYEGDKIIEYRKNGSRFSLETIDDYRSKELIYYSHEGKKTFESTESPNSLTEYTFDKDGAVIKYFYKDNNSGIQKIFNEGDPVLITQYDGNGCFKGYTDNYFEKDGVDIDAEGYMGKSLKAHINHKYNLLYKAAPLSGKILSPVRQGTTGTCYIAGIVNSMVKTIEGRALLDKTLPSDDNTKECVVDFKGLKKRYVFPAEVVSLNMSRLGRRSADYSGMVMAFEKFRESNVSREEYPNLPSDFFRDKRGSNDRRVDSGYPTEFFYALTGKEMKQSGDKITDNDILNARKCLDTGRGVVNAGTIMRMDKNNEIPLEDRAEGITPAHNMAVWKINQNSVTLYDSVTENEIVYPIEKFKKYFSKLYWATLD